MTRVPTVDIERLQQMIEEGAQLVDALPAEDYEKLHIQGAVSVPIEDFSADLLERLDRSRPVVTYCADQQ